MRKPFLALGFILIAGLSGLSSCATAVSEGVLSGAWSLVSSGLLGDGSITLAFVGKLTGDIVLERYAGTATINGNDYLVDAYYSPDLQEAEILLYQTGENPSTNCIHLQDVSYSGEDSLDGDYSGLGAYHDGGAKDIDSGTFAAMKS